MNKAKKMGLLVLGIMTIIGIVLFLVGFFKPKGAGIEIDSVPAASIFINGQQVGRTPYTSIEKPGEIEIRLVPDSFETPLTPYEANVILVSGVKTIIRREFAESIERTKGHVVSFEELPNGESSIAVLSDPDGANVSLDGVRQGFTPYKNNIITTGEHSLTLSADGYEEMTLMVQVIDGYRLTARIKLVPDLNAIKENEEENKVEEIIDEEKISFVEILSTPTNFLRVRSEPSTGSSEIARVIPGKEYEFVEQDENGEWMKIKYDDESAGWVFGDYVKAVDQTDEKQEEQN